MDEYIDADSGCYLLENDRYEFQTDYRRALGLHTGLNRVVHNLVGMPPDDVEPVRHGRWKYYRKQGIAVCTNCSFERKLDADFGRAIACPNCGASMEGDKT